MSGQEHEAMRAEFEAWAFKNGYDVSREPLNDVIYREPTTFAAWFTWQHVVARAARGAPVGFHAENLQRIAVLLHGSTLLSSIELNHLWLAADALATPRPAAPITQMLLYEHADGRARVCPEGQAYFAAGDPQWVRCYPVEVDLPSAPNEMKS